MERFNPLCRPAARQNQTPLRDVTPLRDFTRGKEIPITIKEVVRLHLSEHPPDADQRATCLPGLRQRLQVRVHTLELRGRRDHALRAPPPALHRQALHHRGERMGSGRLGEIDEGVALVHQGLRIQRHVDVVVGTSEPSFIDHLQETCCLGTVRNIPDHEGRFPPRGWPLGRLSAVLLLIRLLAVPSALRAAALCTSAHIHYLGAFAYPTSCCPECSPSCCAVHFRAYSLSWCFCFL